MKTLKSRVVKDLKNAYLVKGEDIFLFDKAREIILKQVNLQSPDMNLTVFDNENFSAKSFLEACEVFPFLDEKRVIVLNGISKILESEKKDFIKYFEKPFESTVVIILDFEKNFDFLNDFCELVDANKMEKSVVLKIVVSNLAKEGKKISQEAFDVLFDACGGYLTKINSELKKLAFCSNEELITKNNVDELVVKDDDYTIFELVDALSKKNGDKALQILKNIEKDRGVFSMICNHFRRLFFVSITNKTNKELASLLNVKEYAVNKAKTFLKAFSKSQLKKINQLLQDCDYFIKSGKMSENNALYFATFNILYI